MSEFRKQLDAEKAAHRAARYPGDLARDVLGRRWGMGGRLAPAVGIAAAVLLAIGLWPGRERPPVVTNVSRPAELAARGMMTTRQMAPTEDSVWTMPAMPALPALPGMPASEEGAAPAMTPPDLGGMPDFGAMPSFPAYADVIASDDSN